MSEGIEAEVTDRVDYKHSHKMTERLRSDTVTHTRLIDALQREEEQSRTPVTHQMTSKPQAFGHERSNQEERARTVGMKREGEWKDEP